MKLLVNVSVWSDSAILPDRVIEFNTKDEFDTCIQKLLSDLKERIDNLPSNRVGFQLKSNVSYKFTSSNFENLSVHYDNLFNDSFFEKLLKL